MKAPSFPTSSSSSSVLRKPRQVSPYLISLLAFILFVSILYGEDFMCIFGHQLQLGPNSDRFVSKTGELTRPSTQIKSVPFLCNLMKKKIVVDWSRVLFVFMGLEKKEKVPFAMRKSREGCDVFRGRWVRDESNRPLYEESECPYIQPQLTCQEHGRPDREYQHWRWQPHDCDLPRSIIIDYLFI